MRNAGGGGFQVFCRNVIPGNLIFFLQWDAMYALEVAVAEYHILLIRLWNETTKQNRG